jgi:hypothetical protein
MRPEPLSRMQLDQQEVDVLLPRDFTNLLSAILHPVSPDLFVFHTDNYAKLPGITG